MELKIGTLGNLVKRTKIVYSTTVLLHQEIEHLKVVFTGINEHPIKTVNKTVFIKHRNYRTQL